MSGRLVPRLDVAAAAARFKVVSRELVDGVAAVDLVDCGHPDAVPNPTGGLPLSPAELDQIRQIVVPRVTPISAQTKVGRDHHALALGRALDETLPISDSDAAHPGVWSFLSLCVFPDLVLARWPMDAGRLSVDRWVGDQLGRDRNYLRTSLRNWRMFGDLNVHALNPLGEDELEALLGRTELARNVPLVRAAARRILEHDPARMGRMMFARELMMGIRRWTGALMLDLLSEQELAAFVDSVADSVLSQHNARAQSN